MRQPSVRTMKPRTFLSYKQEVILLSIIFVGFRVVYARYVESFDSYSSPDDICGTVRKPRVMGGDAVEAGEFPWITSIQTTSGEHFCAGFIVNQKFVISAAHCFHKQYNGLVKYHASGTVLLESLKVVVDHVQLSDESKQIIDVGNLIMHPQFDDKELNNDIAILELKDDAKCSKISCPICLPDILSENVSSGEATVVAGWGSFSCKDNAISNGLQKISVPLWQDEDCKKSYTDARYIFTRRNFLCAGSDEKKTWNGDSGGPLMFLNSQNRWTAIGVLSAGRFGCSENVPDVYTKVSDYIPWIRSQIQTSK